MVLRKCRKWRGSINDHAGVRLALVHQSTVHTMLGDFDAARESLKSSLELPSGSTADEGMVVLHQGWSMPTKDCVPRWQATATS